jgi:protein-disulfide isomerase
VVKFYPYKYRDFAFISAEAALAAHDQGKFAVMHRLMLKQSPKLDRESLIAYAGEAGLDVPRFTASIDQKRNAKLIDRDLALVTSLNLYNTPTFYINGRRIIGNVPYEYLKKIVQEELRKSEK